jgi:hypothetical protein
VIHDHGAKEPEIGVRDHRELRRRIHLDQPDLEAMGVQAGDAAGVEVVVSADDA